jgi:hypothetical protein
MKSYFFTVAAVAFACILLVNSALQATPPKGGSKSPSKVTQPTKTKVKVNVQFHHRTYHGWNRYCWFPEYGCYGFYDPNCGCWYYWYEPAGQFQLVEAMATNVPTTSGASLLPPGAVNLPTPAPTNTNSTTPVTVTFPTPPALPITLAPVEKPPVAEDE